MLMVFSICTSLLLFHFWTHFWRHFTLFTLVSSVCSVVFENLKNSYRFADITLSTLVLIYEVSVSNSTKTIKAYKKKWRSFLNSPKTYFVQYNSRGQESLNKASGITCTRVEKFVVGNIIFFAFASREEQRATREAEREMR